MGFLRRRAFPLVVILVLTSSATLARAAEVLPPKPDRYFNDYAGIISKSDALELNEQLARFERETSNQLIVAIWQTMPSQSSVEDFTQRTFQSWTVGQQGKNNGAVLFIFIKDRRLRIQPGYGLEGALPDITCDLIIRNEIAPRFRTGNFEAGIRAGINAIEQAIKGEYKGSGRTAREQQANKKVGVGFFFFFILFFVMLYLITRGNRGRRGPGSSSFGGPFIGGWSGGSGGWSSSDSGGGGFSGFDGGGGSSGGGGASGSW